MESMKQTKTLTEEDLVKFGNYLFNRYGVNVYSDEGLNVPLYQRQVSDADIRNYMVGSTINES